MIGPEGAAQLLADALADNVPAKLRELELRYGLDPGALLDPKLVIPYELTRTLGLEDWPALMVVAQTTRPGLARVDVSDTGGATYAVRYVFRVFEWARGDSTRETDLARKRLVLAVREVLTARLGLDPAVAYTDVGTLEESYSDLAVDTTGATVAAAYTAVELVVIETADAPAPAGTVGTTQVDTAPLPPHPAL